MGKKVPMRTEAKSHDPADDHIAILERSPERVRSFFQDEQVRYVDQKLHRPGSMVAQE